MIGALIVRDLAGERTIARIVETEAYVPGDAAAHSFRGRTARNGSLFLERGHYCFNVSAGSQGIGAGVLVRAGEPLEGIEVMRRRRGAVADRDLLRGPGRLAQALAIGRAQDGLDLCAAGPLWLAHGAGAPVKIGVSRRIGLTKEIDRPLRFFDRASKVVSGPRLLS